MITRSGFVSNSSSSSFIVAFPKRDSFTQEEIYNLLSPNHDIRSDMDDQTTLIDSWYNEDYTKHTDEDVVNRVIYDLRSPAKESDIMEHMKNLHSEYETWKKFNHIKDWDERQKLVDQVSMEAAIPDLEKLKRSAGQQFGENNFDLYIFRYADDEGEGWLEHSGIFDALPYRRISYH